MALEETCTCMGDAVAGHLEMTLLPLSAEELDMSRLYILRSLGLARSLVLGMFSDIPSRSSSVDWRENSVVASVTALRVVTVTGGMISGEKDEINVRINAMLHRQRQSLVKHTFTCQLRREGNCRCHVTWHLQFTGGWIQIWLNLKPEELVTDFWVKHFLVWILIGADLIQWKIVLNQSHLQCFYDLCESVTSPFNFCEDWKARRINRIYLRILKTQRRQMKSVKCWEPQPLFVSTT